jgi:Tol biopolymer transport system component/DNA-binding winged helix-turn-helix (wHTH) protein
MGPEQVHLFDDFAIDTARGCLLQAGRPVHLRPQAFAALVYLACNRGRLITKGQLTTEVWDGRAVTDDSIVQCIGDIRQALGDGNGSRLRTIRGRGYIFESDSMEVTPALPVPGPVAPAESHTRARMRAAFTVGGVVAIVTGVAVATFMRGSPAAPDPRSFVKLTSSNAIELRPSLSPDGRWFMFDAISAPWFDAAFQIYLQSVTGGATTCLTCNTEGGGLDGAFSPTDDLIAYARDSREGGIFIARRDGRSPRRLTAAGFHPAWSPDGRFIAFSTRRTDWIPVGPLYSSSELWVADVMSGSTRRLDVGDARDPAWSPDGRYVAFWALSKDAHRRDIFVVNSAGDRLTRVTANQGENWSPTWSPEGRTLYFVTNRTGNIGLWEQSIDLSTGAALGAGRAVPVPSAIVSYPRMAPDGSLVFAAASADRNVHLLSFDVEKAIVTGPPSVVTQSTDFWIMPRPSPNGDQLVLARAAFAESQDLFSVRRDGSHLRRLTNDTARDGEPEISPDEGTIAFESNRGGLAAIWLMDADGANLRPLTPPSQTTAWTSPRWSPNGRIIAARRQPGNHVVLLDATHPASPPLMVMPIPEEVALSSAVLPLSLARVAWSPNGRLLAARFGEALLLYSLRDGTYQTRNIGGALVGWPSESNIVLDQWEEQRLSVLDIRTWQTRDIPYAPHLRRDDRLMLSADGRTLAVERGTYQADIWLMRAAARQ